MVTPEKCQTCFMKKESLRKFIIFLKPLFWFLIGFSVALFTLMGIVITYFKVTYQDKVIPGVFIGNTYVGEMKKDQIAKIFDEKNEKVKHATISFSYQEYGATISAEKLKIGYDSSLISTQAFGLGKSTDIFIFLLN